MNKIIDISNLEYHYNSQTKLLFDLNLQLESGSIHGLLGKNGEGKSTLLKLISGLLFPINGKMNILDYEPRKRNSKMLQDIFFLSEELPESNLSIRRFENVYAPFYSKYSSSKFYNNLNELGIERKVKHINEMSYGQRKKLMIAFGLATNARLILMDEPTNGLDIPSKRQFRHLVASAIDKKSCIIISTHQVLDLDDLINSIVIMDNHEIVLNETTENIAKKLIFKLADNSEIEENLIYSEDSLRGMCQVLENNTNQVGRVDIELLFNAVLAQKNRIKNLFSE